MEPPFLTFDQLLDGYSELLSEFLSLHTSFLAEPDLVSPPLSSAFASGHKVNLLPSKVFASKAVEILALNPETVKEPGIEVN
jgi:hypothetical protein